MQFSRPSLELDFLSNCKYGSSKAFAGSANVMARKIILFFG